MVLILTYPDKAVGCPIPSGVPFLILWRCCVSHRNTISRPGRYPPRTRNPIPCRGRDRSSRDAYAGRVHPIPLNPICPVVSSLLWVRISLAGKRSASSRSRCPRPMPSTSMSMPPAPPATRTWSPRRRSSRWWSNPRSASCLAAWTPGWIRPGGPRVAERAVSPAHRGRRRAHHRPDCHRGHRAWHARDRHHL